MSAWDDNDFPKADDPLDVGWMVVSWKITPCYSGCAPEEDYFLESGQFDHLPLSATRPEAIALFDRYIANKRASGRVPNRKGMTLFLAKVERVQMITDQAGDLV